jgi:nitrogen fixation-related uncharacterized protein
VTPVIVTATPTPVVVTNTPVTPIVVTATPTPIVVTNTPTPPPFVTVTPAAPIITVTPAPPHVVCQEMLVNGGFESNDGWRFGDTKLRGSYTGAIFHTGLRSVRLGNDDYSRNNVQSYSSISQRAYLPHSGYTTATISFWYYPISDMEPGDKQELILLDAHTGRTIKVLWRTNENSRQWLHKEKIDVTRYLGRGIIVYFNVFNDGGAGRAAMYVDDVSLKVCGPAPTPIPVQPSTPQIIQPTAAPIQPIPPTASFATATPTALFISPAASTTPADAAPGSPTPVQVWPTAIPTPPPGQTENASFWQTALNALWYILIFLIVILIIVIAFLMIRLLWGQMSDQGDEDAEVNAPVVTEASPEAPETQELTPTEASEPPDSPEDEA